jgi:peptidyl-tRNA hydrolase
MSPDLQKMLDERKHAMTLDIEGYRPLYMYALFRADLEMDIGKLASQSGHAFTLTYEKAKIQRPEITALYNNPKICMYAKNLGQLERAYHECIAANLPCHLVIDSRHIDLPHFTGEPVFTALGIGPVYREEVSHITKRYQLIKK